MAQFGGQKNPPWATQFAATAVSQPGHSGQSIDLNSLHCKYCKPDALSCLIPYHNVMLCSYYMDFIFFTIFLGITSWKNILCYIIIFHWVYFFFPHLRAAGASYSLPTALGVQQPSLLGASPSVYSQQSALAAVSLSNQSAANYQLSQQTAALQQQAAAAAAAALQQVSHCKVAPSTLSSLATVSYNCLIHYYLSLVLLNVCSPR